MIKIILTLISLMLAVQGYLFQTQKDPSKPKGFGNLNRWGKLFLFLIVLFASLSFWKDWKNGEALKEKDEENLALKKQIICASSLDVRIKGILHFQDFTIQDQVIKGFNNFLNSFATIEINITKNGKIYSGQIDAIDPKKISYEKLRNLKEEFFPQEKEYLKDMAKKNSYYIEFSGPLKLTTQDDECFDITHLPSKDSIAVIVKGEKYTEYSGKLYKYSELYVDEVFFINYKFSIPVRQTVLAQPPIK